MTNEPSRTAHLDLVQLSMRPHRLRQALTALMHRMPKSALRTALRRIEDEVSLWQSVEGGVARLRRATCARLVERYEQAKAGRWLRGDASDAVLETAVTEIRRASVLRAAQSTPAPAPAGKVTTGQLPPAAGPIAAAARLLHSAMRRPRGIQT